MRRLALLLAGAALLAMFYAPPAQAGTVIACNGHRQIAFHETAGGNRYQLFAHNCIDDTLSLGSHWYQARTHWHCYRNGSPYDGCRLNTRLTIQTFSLISGWVDETSTYTDVSNPGGSYSCAGSGGPNTGFFTNSSTLESVSFNPNAGERIRGAGIDPDNMRFCLADGSTVLKDVTNSVSQDHIAQ
jgi:hypothetical protein